MTRSRRRLLLWGMVAALVVMAGWLWVDRVYVPGEQMERVTACRAELESIVQERALVVSQWTNSILDEATLVGAYPTTHALLGADPGDVAEARRQSDRILGLIAKTKSLRGLWVLDREDRVVASSPGTGAPPAEAIVQCHSTLRDGRPAVSVLGGTGGTSLTIFCAPARDADGGPTHGTVVAVADSAETLRLIVAGTSPRSGRPQVSLLETRGGALALVEPPRRDGGAGGGPDTAAHAASRAAELAGAVAGAGFGTGQDGRGVPVFAAARHAAGTPWTLLATVDQQAVLDSAAEELLQTGMVAMAIVLALLSIGLGLWRGRSAELLEEIDRRDARFARLLEQANDVMFVIGADGLVRHASIRAQEMYGYPAQELRGMSVTALRSPQDRESIPADLDRIRENSGLVYETRHARRDGTTFPVEISARAVDLDGERAMLSIVRDITVRKREEARVQRLNRFLRTLKQVNELIVRESQRRPLLDGTCAAVVTHGGFLGAWIGFANRETGRIEPAAWTGEIEDYVRKLEVRFDDSPLGGGPTGTCVREGRAVDVGDVESDPRFAPWRGAALAQGIHSSAACPLRVGGEVVGALSVYSAERGTCGGEMLDLIGELASDLGFALQVIEERRKSESLRAEAEAALRDSESQSRKHAAELEAVLNAIPVPVWISRDPQCRSAQGNAAAYQLLEIEEGADLGVGAIFGELANRGRLMQNGVPITAGQFAPLLAARSNASLRDVRIDVVEPDGRLSHLMGNASPLRGPDGAAVGAVCAFLDVTGEVRSRRELEILRRAINQSPASVVITDAKGDIEYVNATFCQVTGYSMEEVRGRNPRILKSGQTPASTYEELWEFITAGREWRGEFVNRRKNGETYREAVIVSPILDDERRITHFLAVKEDVTARQKTEADLAEMRREFAQVQKMEAVGRLAGGVAHDFNNLLSVILGYTDIALEDLAPSDPRRSGLEQVREASERAAGLTRQLLAFSRKQVIEPRVLDLNALITGLAKMLRRLIGEDIELVTQLADGLGPVRADPGQIEQVLVNLVVNARDAMPRGGRIVIATANGGAASERRDRRFDGSGPGTVVNMSVSDTGCGIPAEIRERIFEPFFTTKAEGKGTGLGLSTVYGIVRQSGGSIWLESEVGSGTTFHITLPRSDGQASAPRRKTDPAALKPATGTILLVEDDDAVRELVRVMLHTLGYRVIVCAGVEEAIRAAGETSERIDLLLTDVVMPQGRGTDLARRIRDRIAGGRVLFMSGYLDIDLPDSKELPEGMHLLHKPFTSEALAQRVREVLKSAPAGGEGGPPGT